MKFTVRQVAKSGAARLGIISDFCRKPKLVFETPLLLLHTRGGSVPYLSYDLLQMVTEEQQIMQTPLVSLIDSTENIKSLGKGVAEFSGLKEYLTMATAQDSGIQLQQGYHDKNAVSLWTRGGRKLVDAATYISSMEIMKPDVFQLLADGDTSHESSKKRIQKSVDATLRFAEICTALREKSESLRETPILASVVGGFNTSERLRCAKVLQSLDVDGYVIDGFHTNGPTATDLDWEEVEPILTATLGILANDKLRMFNGAVTPCILLKLVSKGVDVFDASFPLMATERGCALTFPNSIQSDDKKIGPIETLPNILGDKVENHSTPPLPGNPYEINLKHRTFMEDFKPLVPTCACYACRKYSRAYLHHLLVTNELLGPTLLMMHNLHHYLDFFRNIRAAIHSDRLFVLEDLLQKGASEFTHTL